MFGQNPLRTREESNGSVLWVQEIFDTIQGEGPLAGTPAIFIRLAGCNLACTFCDTDFESSSWHPEVGEICQRVHELTAECLPLPLIVITGGEPFRQNMLPLITLLRAHGHAVQIETAGTLDYHTDEIRHTGATIVVSPKTPKVHPIFYRVASAFKYIIRAGETSPDDGLPIYSTQSENQKTIRPLARCNNLPIYVQPCDEHDDPARTLANTREAVRVARRHGYHLSLQLHKILDLP